MKNIVLSCLKICTTSTVAIIHNILELNHHNTKLPFSTVMLHPAPQIKLWGGEDLEAIRENHPLQNTSLQLTKNSSSLNKQMLTLQIHNIYSHIKMNKVDIHKCMPSYNRANWNNSYKNFIKRHGPQYTHNKRYIDPTCMQPLSMYAHNISSQINTWTHTKNQKTSYYKTTKAITHLNNYFKIHRYGYQHISPPTYTIGIPSHKIHLSFFTLHPTPQTKVERGKNHGNAKRNFTRLKTTRILTQTIVVLRMSQRGTNSSSSQRYKEKLLALENDPDIDMFVTQKCTSSSSQATLTHKKAKGKPNTGSTHPPFWLGFQAMNWTNRGNGLPKDNHVPITTLVKKRDERKRG